ncbi:MAG: hypothetical protein ACT4N2_14100 [Hyphomicrobium sp.]
MVDLSVLKRERDEAFIAKAGPALYAELLPKLRKVKLARYVVIAVETGGYETGGTMAEAADAFERKHGDALGYIRRIE